MEKGNHNNPSEAPGEESVNMWTEAYLDHHDSRPDTQVESGVDSSPERAEMASKGQEIAINLLGNLSGKYKRGLDRAGAARDAIHEGLDGFGSKLDSVVDKLNRAPGLVAEKAKNLFGQTKDFVGGKYEESLARRDSLKAERAKARDARAEARATRRNERRVARGNSNTPELSRNTQEASKESFQPEKVQSIPVTYEEKTATPEPVEVRVGAADRQDENAIIRASELIAQRNRELAELAEERRLAKLAEEAAARKVEEAKQQLKLVESEDSPSDNAVKKAKAMLDLAEVDLDEKSEMRDGIDKKIITVDELISNMELAAKDAGNRINERRNQAVAAKEARKQSRQEARRDFGEAAIDRVAKFIDEDAPKFMRKAGSLLHRVVAKLANKISNRMNGSPKRAIEGRVEPSGAAPRRAAAESEPIGDREDYSLAA